MVCQQTKKAQHAPIAIKKVLYNPSSLSESDESDDVNNVVIPNKEKEEKGREYMSSFSIRKLLNVDNNYHNYSTHFIKNIHLFSFH